MVELKPFNFDNAEKHYKWNNDEELNYYDSDYPLSPESFESFTNRLKLVIDENNKTSQLLEIHENNLKTLIGIVDIYDIDLHNGHCNIEIFIGEREYRNRGYGTSALRKALAYCFEELDMHKVNATSFDFNENWINILKKLSFKQEGILREDVNKNGVYHDKLIFSLLKGGFMHFKKDNVAVGVN